MTDFHLLQKNRSIQMQFVTILSTMQPLFRSGKKYDEICTRATLDQRLRV